MGNAEQNELAMKLVTRMLEGAIADIRPKLDFTIEAGFTYPAVVQALNISGQEVVSLLDSMTAKGILKKDFYDRLLRCPQCQSLNLSPSIQCSKCGSANVTRGRVLEHFVCKYVGLEDEFISRGRYICPKCQGELRTLGVDYQSLGLLRKCYDCNDIFNTPVIRWRCLQCSSLTGEDRVEEVNIYSYSLDETRRSWLEFELKPKSELINYLKQCGYEVTEHARVKGRSGAEHNIDILASRDDGVVTHDIAIGVEVAGDKIGLDKIFAFDDKAYDIGIHDKMLVVIPGLGGEAEKFAAEQRIKVLAVRDLESVLAGGVPRVGKETSPKPFEFRSKEQLVEFLRQAGYEVVENARMKGRSGAEHVIDILATRDEGIITHHVAIGIVSETKPVGLDRVFGFDDKTYDIGIRDKVLIAVPGLTEEARRFAQRQHIRVFEAAGL